MVHHRGITLWYSIGKVQDDAPLGITHATLLELPYVVCASIDRTTLLSVLRCTHHVALTKLLLPSCLYRDTISKLIVPRYNLQVFFGSVHAYLALLC